MTAFPNPPAGPPAHLTLLVNNEGQGSLVRPVDPVSLQDIEGLSPFEGPRTYAISPDRRMLAAVVYSRGELRLLDLEAWTESRTTVTDNGNASGLVFSSDGKVLYWTQPPRAGPSTSPLDLRLYRYDIERDKLEEVLRFPAAFLPGERRFLRSGRLAVYGALLDKRGRSEGAPRLLLVAPEEGRIVADMALEGVKAGAYSADGPSDVSAASGIYRPGVAWDMAGEHLYVAHPDSDKITVVDLAGGKVLGQADVGRRLSLWGRVLGWFTTTAEAKLEPETEREVAISRDGTTLYVTGTRRDVVKQRDGKLYSCVVSHGGLRAISTGDLRELRKLDIAVDSVAVSPDGELLLLRGATGNVECDNNPGGLYVVDAHTFEARAHLEPQTHLSLRGFSWDGRYAYVSNGDYPETSVRVLDLQSLEFAAERSVANFWNILPPVGP